MADDFSQVNVVNAIIRARRGTNAEVSQKVFDNGEIVYTTDKKRLNVGDASTLGGVLVGNRVFFSNSFVSTSALTVKYDLVYRYDTNLFYMLTGDNPSNVSNYFAFAGKSLTSTGTTYTLPAATSSTLGGVIKGDGLYVDGSGVLSVKVDGNIIGINNSGELSINLNNLDTALGGTNTPIATPSTVGTVKPSTGLQVDGTGLLTVPVDNTTVKIGQNGLYVDQSGLSSLKINDGVTDLDITTITIVDGNGLHISSSGVLSASTSDSSTLGSIILGQGLSGNPSGKVDVPLANSSTFGGGVLGQGLSSRTDTNAIIVSIDDSSIKYDGSNQWLYAAVKPTSPNVSRGWIVFDGTGANGLKTTLNSFGALSATKSATGVYTITWPMSLSAASANYPWTAHVQTPSLGTMNSVSMSAQTLTSTIINVVQHSGSPVSADSSVIAFTFFSN